FTISPCSVIRARDLTKEYVHEIMPDKMKYLVLLKCSYDGNPLKDGEVVFDEDDKNLRTEYEDINDVADFLWRDGFIPEWIDVSAYKQDENFSYIKLACCGRYSKQKEHIYHKFLSNPPFKVNGVALPKEYIESECRGEVPEKFSLYWFENREVLPEPIRTGYRLERRKRFSAIRFGFSAGLIFYKRIDGEYIAVNSLDELERLHNSNLLYIKNE
ncbi:hypothetical protein AB4341_05725, partial [Vibrio breoganii]